MLWRMYSESAVETVSVTPSGSVGRMTSSSAITASTTSSVFESLWRTMPRPTDGRKSARRALR